MTDLQTKIQNILSQIFIAVPYHRLVDEFFDLVMKMGANLELGMHAEALDRFSLDDFKTMAAKFKDRSMKTTMHAAFMDINPGSLEPLVRKASQSRIHQVLDLVEVFHPRSVVCHLGYIPVAHSEFEEAWMTNTIQFWSSLAPKVRRPGDHNLPGKRLRMEAGADENRDGGRELPAHFATASTPGTRWPSPARHGKNGFPSCTRIWRKFTSTTTLGRRTNTGPSARGIFPLAICFPGSGSGILNQS